MPVALLAAVALQAAAPSADPLTALGVSVAQPLSPAAAAAARARVDAALAQAGASTAFENVSTAYGGEVRARLSGLKCGLGERGQSVMVLPLGPGAVGCRTVGDGGTYAARVRPAAASETLDSAFTAARAEAQRESGYRLFEGAVVDGHPKAGSGRPDHRNLRYFSRVDGRDAFTKVQVGLAYGWVLTERHAKPPPATTSSPDMGELMEEATFGADLHPAP